MLSNVMYVFCNERIIIWPYWISCRIIHNVWRHLHQGTRSYIRKRLLETVRLIISEIIFYLWSKYIATSAQKSQLWLRLNWQWFWIKNRNKNRQSLNFAIYFCWKVITEVVNQFLWPGLYKTALNSRQNSLNTVYFCFLNFKAICCLGSLLFWQNSHWNC